MKKIIIALCALAMGQTVTAQTNDPIVMTVNGVDVTRSEFEYSYNKNNTDMVLDRKSLDEYVDLFVNYKLKVAAALDARLDTMEAFKKEVADYRAQQAEEYLIDSAFIDQEARKTYQATADRVGPEGQLLASHIMMIVSQRATAAEQTLAKQRIDSVYAALKAGADFAELAKKHSQDRGSAQNGGQLPWFFRGQMIPDFEAEVMKLKPGEMSAPFLSTVGYHIVLLHERKPFEPYEYHRQSIYQFLEQRGIRSHAKRSMGEKLAAEMGGNITPEEALAKAEQELDTKYPDFGFLMKEFYDGSLLYEISTREVWDKAAQDEKGLEKYFKKNKKNYRYEEPVYRGLVVHCVSDDVLKQVKKVIKRKPQKEWVTLIREACNNDSLIQVKMVRGPVTADYQSHLEKLWIAELRKKYSVVLYPEVLDTVNKH